MGYVSAVVQKQVNKQEKDANGDEKGSGQDVYACCEDRMYKGVNL